MRIALTNFQRKGFSKLHIVLSYFTKSYSKGSTRIIEFTDIFRLIQGLFRKTAQRSGRRLLVYIYKRKSGFHINQRAAKTTEPKILEYGAKILLMT